jgi:hypothetical protein
LVVSGGIMQVMGFFKKHSRLAAFIVVALLTLPSAIDAFLNLYGRFEEVPMPSLDLGLGKWLLPLIGIVLAIVIIWQGRRTATSQQGGDLTLEDIKSDLVTMNAREREIATKKGNQPCPKETAGQIYDDFSALFPSDTVINSITQRVTRNHDIEPLIEFFRQFGDILDNNGYGLKMDLENDEVYKSSRMDLAQKKLKLKMGKKEKDITQRNIDRVSSLTYGLNSSILLRHILNSIPEVKSRVPTIIRVALESTETITEKMLTKLLNDLDKEWKVTVNFK